MLFRKDIEPCCAYCERGSRISETQVACAKKGVMGAEQHCSAFRYDPLKRVPARPATLTTDKLTKEDFEI